MPQGVWGEIEREGNATARPSLQRRGEECEGNGAMKTLSEVMDGLMADPEEFMDLNREMIQEVRRDPDVLHYILGIAGQGAIDGFDLLQAISVGVAIGNAMKD